jgi:phenylpropionate dioxygenase-like ring-hydroxylating dioxygenase large terminal subunit|tara:strand:- start:1089 stop:1940 length:852 start_codon:yes stop_codon:yes gene_type:complete
MACFDKLLLDDWHVVASLEILSQEIPFKTILFEQSILVSLSAYGKPIVNSTLDGREMLSKIQYGFVWTCCGTPKRDIVSISETLEEDRIIVSGGSFGVHVSGLRVVENFLDMGHFPFIHNGWLGEEPHTEVQPYKVHITEADEVYATECVFYQPVASPTAEGGMMADYEYKVLRPYIVCLYKSNPIHPKRMDYIALFIQPVSPERCIAHTYLCYIKDGMTTETLRWFMQLIFSQDKPILENQLPKRLPLDPRAETPIRADKVAIAYRRWLQDHQVTYGAIPAA